MIKRIYFILITLTFIAHNVSGAWIQRANFPGGGRHRGTALSIGNKGYMGLGHYNGAGPNVVKKDWWEYDPGTNAWAQKADYIGNNGNGNYAPIHWSIGNFGYLAGGTLGDAMLYKYDPTTNLWASVNPCPTTPGNNDGFVIDTKGYYLSGSNLYEFDAISETWSTKSPAPFSANTWNSAFTINGKAYVKNGTSLWEYKPSIDAWTPRASFPGLALAASISFIQDGKGYIVAGYGAGFLADVNSEAWEYNPDQNEWNSIEEFDGTSRRFGSAFNIGNRAFFGIGTNGTNFNDFWEFDKFASIKEIFDASTFTTYPNPSSDFINFKSVNVDEFTIEIYDVIGRKIFADQTTNGVVHFTKGLNNSGVYIYHVTIDGTIIHSNKFIFN